MHSLIGRKASLAALVAISVVLLGCPQQVKVGDLTSNPSRYAN